MKQYLFNTIVIIIILVSSFSLGYYYNKKVNVVNTKQTIVTIIDTIQVQGKATIQYQTIYIQTIIDNSVTQIDTVFVALTDTIAYIDTTFTSQDQTIKSQLNIKYSYNEQSFWIKNILTHKHKQTISYVDKSNIDKSNVDKSKFNRFGISTYVIDNNIGLGLHYHLSNNLCLGFGYDNNDNIMVQIQFNF